MARACEADHHLQVHDGFFTCSSTAPHSHSQIPIATYFCSPMYYLVISSSFHFISFPFFFLFYSDTQSITLTLFQFSILPFAFLPIGVCFFFNFTYLSHPSSLWSKGNFPVSPLKGFVTGSNKFPTFFPKPHKF